LQLKEKYLLDVVEILLSVSTTLHTFREENRLFVEMAYQSRTGFKYQVSQEKCMVAYTFFV
jgi:hypothetical protein